MTILGLGVLLLLFSRPNHACGWSHFRRDGWAPLYLIADDSEVHFYIDGMITGIAGQGMIWVPAKTKKIELAYFRDGKLFASEIVQCGGTPQWIMAPRVKESSAIHQQNLM